MEEQVKAPQQAACYSASRVAEPARHSSAALVGLQEHRTAGLFALPDFDCFAAAGGNSNSGSVLDLIRNPDRSSGLAAVAFCFCAWALVGIDMYSAAPQDPGSVLHFGRAAVAWTCPAKQAETCKQDIQTAGFFCSNSW